MKRAWPYALALAVVVTGCYLALAPLLRSLSPAPTASANRLSQNSNVTTVGKSKTIRFTGADPGTTALVSNLRVKKKAKKVSKPPVKTPAAPKVTPSPQSSTTSGVSSTPPASSSTSAPKTTKTTSSSTTKTANRKSAPVGGQIDQSQSDSGFASPTGGGTVTSGQTLAPGN